MLNMRSSQPEVFLGKGVLKIFSGFTGEHSCWSVLCNFIETTLRYGSSPVNLLNIFRKPFSKNTSGGIATQGFNELTAENFAARLKQANLIWLNLISIIN